MVPAKPETFPRPNPAKEYSYDIKFHRSSQQVSIQNPNCFLPGLSEPNMGGNFYNIRITKEFWP